MTRSNRLSTLAEAARRAHTESLHHSECAADRAIAAGGALTEAKALCVHGAWGAWVADTGIPERTAQRYMTLHRTGLNSATVADLGGIGAAATWSGQLRLPKNGNALLAAVSDWGAEPYQSMGMIWRGRGGHHVGLMDLDARWPQAWVTRRPLTQERAVWVTLWHLFTHQHHHLSELHFEALSGDGWRDMVEAFEAVCSDAGAAQ